MQGGGVTVGTCGRISGCRCVAAPTPAGMLEVAAEAAFIEYVYCVLVITIDCLKTVKLVAA
jgi:hypothetical protein